MLQRPLLDPGTQSHLLCSEWGPLSTGPQVRTRGHTPTPELSVFRQHWQEPGSDPLKEKGGAVYTLERSRLSGPEFASLQRSIAALAAIPGE